MKIDQNDQKMKIMNKIWTTKMKMNEMILKNENNEQNSN